MNGRYLFVDKEHVRMVLERMRKLYPTVTFTRPHNFTDRILAESETLPDALVQDMEDKVAALVEQSKR